MLRPIIGTIAFLLPAYLGCARAPSIPPAAREAGPTGAQPAAQASPSSPPEAPSALPSESAAKFSVGAGAPVFVAAPETAASSVTNAHGEAPALTPDDQKRFDAVATKFVQAMNSEDSTAYRALHSTEGWNSAIDWWKNMFAQQRAKFGAIVKAYPCTRGVIRFGQFGFRCTDLPNGVSFVALFEERVGGVFSFEMDSDGRISATSVFIKEELATYEPGNTPPIFSR